VWFGPSPHNSVACFFAVFSRITIATVFTTIYFYDADDKRRHALSLIFSAEDIMTMICVSSWDIRVSWCSLGPSTYVNLSVAAFKLLSDALICPKHFRA
jgi:hypothetical protein